MKRALCLVLALAMLLSLGGCGGELPHFVKDVDDLTDFRCYIATNEDETVLLRDDDAKAVYHLITEALRDMQEATDSPSGKRIGMVFYVGDSENPLLDYDGVEQEYGDYSVAENGVGMYTASVWFSSSIGYQVKPSVYTALLKMM